MLFTLRIQLDEIYTGVTKELEITVDKKCSACKGDGSKPNSIKYSCEACHGKGSQVILSKTPFGLVQQAIECNACEGKGKCASPSDICLDCNGKKIIPTKKKLRVEVEKGAPDGCKYKFSGEGNDAFGYETGDVHVELFLENKSIFERKGADLATTIDITVIEALTQFEIELTHLDGRKIYIKNKKGEVIQPGSIKTIYDAGMPFHTTPFKFGNLYISFNVIIPKLEGNNKEKLIELFKEENELIKKQLSEIKEDKIKLSKVEIVPFEAKYLNTDEKGGKKPEKKKSLIDEEEEENERHQYTNSHYHQGRGGRGRGGVQYVQCGNQ